MSVSYAQKNIVDESDNFASYTTKDVDIVDILIPTNKPQGRSAGKTVEAYYNYDFNCMEFYFCKNVGVVTVYIFINGSCISSGNCDTSVEDIVLIQNIPANPGAYTIKIIGNNYEGYGCFDL